MSDRRSILVTGASRGIGAAIAEALAEAGYLVGCLSRSGALPDRPEASETARANWIAFAGDVTDKDALERACRSLAEHAPLVGLVNNAGLHRTHRSSEITTADWDAMVSVNVTSVIVGAQCAYPHLVAAGGGLIVNIGSFFDKLGVKRNLAYCASKAAVAAIGRVLAVEWAAEGVRTLTVAPGYIVTDLNGDAMAEGPLRTYLEKRIPRAVPGSADEVARVVGGLFQMECGFLTGETIYLDGGQGVAH
jgi:NAD(P)-dependent dehydrogenase (short-subunit alcohol dehydrogenase family)